MNDDWRLQIDLHEEGRAHALTERLDGEQLEHDLSDAFHDRVVRVDLPSRHDAVRFSEQLRGEGLPTVHRWRFLLVGATDEDMAKELAERIRNEAPSGSRVKVEGTWAAAYVERPPNPFAVLGGLGG